ncbi:MAG: flagellar hook-associated protein FlgK [Clostridiales bacterium GWB2_37_7]|nr:MAG: flagellar hook-associated protein FlgK [Clostridiales bacterium GWB2_37_7]
MRTTFGTFNTATSGLFASQRSLDIVSNNISNANTEGYSRQQVLQRASIPVGGDPRGLVGTGVETYDVVQIRSQYMDNKYWGQVKAYAEWNTKSEGLQEVEGIFNEPSDTGIRKVMDEMFASIEELVKKSGDNTNRVNLIEKAVTFSNTIRGFGQQIVDSIRDTNFAIKSKVDEVNALASQITELNKQIFNMELDGRKSNGLRDQRSTLVDKLSQMVNISVSEVSGEGNAKYFNVKIGGITLVNHYQTNKLTTDNVDIPGVSELGTGKISVIKWAGVNGAPLDEVKVESGELKGMLDMRDGNGENYSYRGLPFYLNQLNRFARDFAKAFNEQHKAGVDQDGDPGVNFFDEPTDTVTPLDTTDDWKNVTSINLKVNAAIKGSPSMVAAADAAAGESNNENAKLLASLRNKRDTFYDATTTSKINGTADDFIKSILSVLSVDTNQAKRLTTNTEAIVEQTKNKRMSESGVSLDEEMGNMVKFQQAYNASARMITTLDGIMDTMINRLGIVGR